MNEFENHSQKQKNYFLRLLSQNYSQEIHR